MINFKIALTLITLTMASLSYAEDLEGTVQTVIIEDFAHSETQHILIRSGQPDLIMNKVDAHSLKLFKGLAPRTKIKISGKKTKAGFEVSQSTLGRGSLTGKSSARTSAAVPISLVPGVRSVAVIPLYFDIPGTSPACEPELVKGFLSANGAITKHYNENLQGKVSFNPTLLEPVLVDGTQNCTNGYSSWKYQAGEYFKKKGINIYNYNIIMLLVPKGATCAASLGWLGDGNNYNDMGVLIHPSHCTNPGAIGHEIGHTIGWHHASTPTSEYGDFSDIMGGATLIHSSSPRKMSTGIVKANQIQMITGPGLYRISSLKQDNSEIKVLRWTLRNIVALRSQPFTDLYVSYRTWDGIDALAPIQANFNKTHLHLWANDINSYTQLIGYVGDNETADVTEHPVTVTQVGHDAQSSLVCIKIDGVGDCSVEIAPPRNIDTYNYVTTPKLKLNATITDESVPYVGSVTFKINNGAPVVDNTAPYSVCGDEGTDPCEALAAGNHQVTITAYAGANGAGSAGPAVTKDFSKAGGALPVTITSFTGSSGRGGVTLVWKTTGESNFDRFEVQSALDAKTWSQVSTVKGTLAGAYSVTVPATASVLYFRLKMVDRDGTFQFSRIIDVKSSSVTNSGLAPKLLPRPPSPRQVNGRLK